jgi:trehalose 6-phosphate synthase
MEQCDVLLANSREDGMNLVVKEWAVTSRRPGVAIVAETAGVAAELGESLLQISPLDIEGTAEAMEWGLDMPAAERRARLARLREKIEAWTADHWLSAQLEALGLKRAVGAQEKDRGSTLHNKAELMASIRPEFSTSEQP